MKNIYEKTIKWCINFCSKKNSKIYLNTISFIESIFFPLPTDIFLFPFVLANKKEYLKITIYVTLFSVLGGLVAYYIGHFIWNEVSPILMEVYPKYISKINHFNNQFTEIGILLIIIGGFSPFPYKITCIGSGIIGINIFLFIIFSILSRFLRFFLVSYFIYKYGETTKNIIGKYINIISIIIVVILIIYIFSIL